MLSRRLLHSSFSGVRHSLLSSSKGTLFKNFGVSKHSPPSVLCEPLKHRHLLNLSGPDTTDFLQGLITNDIQCLNNSENQDESLSSMYSMLLCAKGKVLYDTLLYKVAEGEYLLECDATLLPLMQKNLQKFKLRQKVNIKPESAMCAWVIMPAEDSLIHSEAHSTELVTHLRTKNNVIAVVKDPRIPQLGHRIIVEGNIDLRTLATDFNLTQNSSYDTLRYKLGIGEGARDHPLGACFPFECNIDFLHGISFRKGCYLGQEHTSRVRHTGVVRKRLMPVNFVSSEDINPPADCAIVNEKGAKMGKLRSRMGQYGLAVLNVQDSLRSRVLKLAGHEIEVEVTRPCWWPQDLDERGFDRVDIF